MITTLSRQARRRYPQFGNASPQVFFVSNRGTTAAAEIAYVPYTISGMALSKEITFSGMELSKEFTLSGLDVS